MRILSAGWLGYPEEALLERSVNFAFTNRISASRLVDLVIFSIFDSLVMLLVFALLRALLRNGWIAAAVWVLAMSMTLASSGQTHWLSGIFACAISLLALFGMIRFGLVAVIVGWMIYFVFNNYPMTLTLSAWYSSIGCIALFVVGAITPRLSDFVGRKAPPGRTRRRISFRLSSGAKAFMKKRSMEFRCRTVAFELEP